MPLINMCTKVIKETAWSGVIHRRYCQKPVYNDGLCAYHYRRKIAKSIPYGVRAGYEQATQEDLDKMRTLYLKTMGSYGGHKCIKGVIVSSDGYNKPTKIKADPALFVVNNHQHK